MPVKHPPTSPTWGLLTLTPLHVRQALIPSAFVPHPFSRPCPAFCKGRCPSCQSSLCFSPSPGRLPPVLQGLLPHLCLHHPRYYYMAQHLSHQRARRQNLHRSGHIHLLFHFRYNMMTLEKFVPRVLVFLPLPVPSFQALHDTVEESFQ